MSHSYRFPKVSLIISLITQFYVDARPLASHVGCGLTSVAANAKEGILYDRETVMGTPVVYNPASPLAEMLDKVGYWYPLEMSTDYPTSGGMVVHTFNGKLRITSSSTALQNGDCADTDDIVYNVKPGDIIEWRPDDDSAFVTVLQSNGFGVSFNNVRFSIEGLIEEVTPTQSPTVAGETDAPSVSDTNAPTIADGSSGSGDDGDEEEDFSTEDRIFRIIIALLTLGYAIFVWDTIGPLKMMGLHWE